MGARDLLRLLGPPGLIAIALSLVVPARAQAGVVVAAGGGVVFHFEYPESFAPTPWLAVRFPLSDSWSVVTRAGYERFAPTTALLEVPIREPFGDRLVPSSPIMVPREIYVPLGLGVHLELARPSPVRTHLFVECLATLSKARLEREVYTYNIERRLGWSTESSDYWLPGVDVYAGFRRPVSDAFGAEWGVRVAARETPRGSEVERLMGYNEHSTSVVSLVAALTMSP